MRTNSEVRRAFRLGGVPIQGSPDAGVSVSFLGARLALLPCYLLSQDPFITRRERIAHPWKSGKKIRGGKSGGLRAFRLWRGTDPGGDVDVLDADAGAPGDFAAGFVFRHGLHEFVSKKSQLDSHRPIGCFPLLKLPP